MLSATADYAITNGAVISTSRFDAAMRKAADLSRYTTAQLDFADRWVAFTPEFHEWFDSGGNASTSGTLSVNMTNFVGPLPAPSIGNDSTSGPSSTTPGPTTSFSTLGIVQTIDRFPGAELWTFPADVAWQLAASEMESAVGAGQFYPLIGHRMAKKLVPNDPYYRDQWHLDNRRQSNGVAGEDANVVEVWDEYRGAGIMIGIVDDGIDFGHSDLIPSLAYDLSANYSGVPPVGGGADPFNEDYHGTAVAGIAAARGNNNVGVSGVAPEAGLASIRLISGNPSDFDEGLALSHAAQAIDIYNNSWGPVDGVDWLLAPGPMALAAIQNGSVGGSIYTWAAGNGLEYGDNVNYDGYANLIETIAVAAVDDRGRQSEYSEPGAAILISAPSSRDSLGLESGVITTDLSLSQGYNYVAGNADDDNFRDLSYTSTMGGTSAATPVVSGVVALMLDANPNLGWRDVHAILAETARKNDPNDNGWFTNAAGYEFNHKYGFGVVDAGAAVSLAENWTRLGQGRAS
jgi:subtilisin family serine protease